MQHLESFLRKIFWILRLLGLCWVRQGVEKEGGGWGGVVIRRSGDAFRDCSSLDLVTLSVASVDKVVLKKRLCPRFLGGGVGK